MPRVRLSARKLEERLLAKSMPEPNSGCWFWLGATKAAGYGHMWIGDRYELVHRLSHQLFVGPIPTGYVVMHICDVPCCINPDHLKAGTVQDNIDDCVNKGRARRGRFPGESHPFAKLTAKDVQEIREAPRFYGWRIPFAQRYGVTPTTISSIIRGDTWREP